MAPTLEQMARSLVESGEYRVTGRLGAQAEYHPPDDLPKVVAAVVDVETPARTPIATKSWNSASASSNLNRQSGRIYKVLGSWEWLEDPGFPIPSEITNIP